MEYGLIGEQLGHSYSQIIHESFGLYSYELCPLSKEAFPLFMQKRDFKGINVTIPYKRDVIPYLDELDEAARAIGAVNTIVNRDGKLIGYNTDVSGFLWMLKKHGIDPAHKKVLVLGTGGASAAVYAALHAAGARHILFVSRTAKETAVSYEEAYLHHTDVQLIVNTTPVGMFPHVDASPIDLSAFSECQAVIDVIYNPSETKLTAQAKALGMIGITGLDMLLAQAKYAAEHFLDRSFDDTLIENASKHLSFSRK
ncbi:MAG: shikimate dehydrogenase [Lachnospiraceae bacterium]|nr:shikimate dehydrogenase [Lachnospiraceae bacterium]